MFSGKTLEEAHNLIKKTGEEDYDGNRYKIGFDHGQQYNVVGFKINDKTPLWSEFLEVDYINGFKSGFKYQDIVNIVSEGLMENVPRCYGISTDYPINIQSLDMTRDRLIKVIFGIILNDGDVIDILIESRNEVIIFGLIGPTYLHEIINYPLVEINNHLETKKEALHDRFVQFDSKGFYIYEEF